MTDYYYLNTYCFDSAEFIPKVNVTFHGFGIMASYEKIDITYIVKYAIGDDDCSEEFEILKPWGDIDEE
jgi:hypothetical protein